MTHTLRVTDGTTTVTGTSGDAYLAEYSPAVSADLSQPLKEQATVGFFGTLASIRSKVGDLNRLFQQAQAYQRTHAGSRVYVEFDPGDSGDFYRSLLYSGRAWFDADVLGPEWAAQNIDVNLEWTRQPFWEGDLTQVQLSNGSDTDNLSGITVGNCNDATHENWVDIKAGEILGDLPAPIKLQMFNSDTDSNDSDEIFVWHNVYSSPAAFVHVVEAEGSSDATETTDATSSGGSYGTIAWSTDVETMVAEWTLASTDLSDASGGRFGILARFAGQFPYSDAWLRVKLETTTNYYDLWVGELSLVSSSTDGRELKLLDTLRLPPYLEGQTSIRELALRLYARRDAASSSFDLDYLQLSPISGDAGWLWFRAVDRGVPPSRYFVHDAIEGITYRMDGTGDFISTFSQKGGPVLLQPAAAQRLYFNTSDYTGTAAVAQTWIVKLWYRPRRYSI